MAISFGHLFLGYTLVFHDLFSDVLSVGKVNRSVDADQDDSIVSFCVGILFDVTVDIGSGEPSQYGRVGIGRLVGDNQQGYRNGNFQSNFNTQKHGS